MKASQSSAKRRTAKKDITPAGTKTLRKFVAYLRSQRAAYLNRRPHRSFKLTRPRDAHRSLELPGYWSFTFYVLRILRSNASLFLRLVAVYTVAGALLVGLSSQDTYAQLSSLLDDTSSGFIGGGWGYVGQGGLLLIAGISGGLSPELTEAQQIYAGLLLILIWLTAVWLLRASMANKRPKLRDALYNAGAPIVATIAVMLVLLVQLIPAALGVIIASSASSTELFDYGVVAMLVCIVAVLLVLLSVYWAVASIFALVVVTLPGMYPWRALRTAGDLVVGRRLRLLLRFLWMIVFGVIWWSVIILMIILAVRLLTSLLPIIESVPIVPLAMAVMSAFMIVWFASYSYLLYRKVVEDDANPA